jgi:hypothetical protein
MPRISRVRMAGQVLSIPDLAQLCDITSSVSIVKPTRCTIFEFIEYHSTCLTIFPSIIRSSELHAQHQVYVIQVSWLHTSRHEMELQFHLVPASEQSTNLYDIYLMLHVQSWTHDDGRKDRPRHVQWYSINSKIVHLDGFTIEIYHDAWSHKRQNNQ